MAKHEYLAEYDRAAIYASLLESARQSRELAARPEIKQCGLAATFETQANNAEILAAKIEAADVIKLTTELSTGVQL
jgi:hypothetical protein